MTHSAETRLRNLGRSRWAAWEHEVLSRVACPAECQGIIRTRQRTVDDDLGEAEEVAACFRSELKRRGHDPFTCCVFIPSRIAAWWLELAMNRRWATNKSTAHLKTLSIRELAYTKTNGQPGWRWTGAGQQNAAGPGGLKMTLLNNLPPEDGNEDGGRGRFRRRSV